MNGNKTIIRSSVGQQGTHQLDLEQMWLAMRADVVNCLWDNWNSPGIKQKQLIDIEYIPDSRAR